MTIGSDIRWIEGPPLEDPDLVALSVQLWTRAATLTGRGAGEPEAPRDVLSAEALLDEAAGWIVAALEAQAPGVTPRLLVSVMDVLRDVREAGVDWRARAFGRVHETLGRLRGVESLRQLAQLAPVELCRCGYDRAMFSRLDGSVARPEAFSIRDDPDHARELLRVGRGAPLVLDHLSVETEMLRRRGPILVADAQAHPGVHPPLRDATRTQSYVAAPVVSQGEVRGFVHADCYVTRRQLDEFDRDLVLMFAEALGYAWERTVLTERLQALRQGVRRDHQSILALVDEFTDADLEMARVDRHDHDITRSAAAMFVAAESRLDSLLTRRELDVVKLMAVGETNAGIARKLVVSEGTVKSHVKHILRKLRAKNRAEAVSRFIKLSRQQPHVEEQH